jgi:hypothetical protein
MAKEATSRAANSCFMMKFPDEKEGKVAQLISVGCDT